MSGEEELVTSTRFFDHIRVLYVFHLVTQLDKLFSPDLKNQKRSFAHLFKRLESRPWDQSIIDYLASKNGRWVDVRTIEATVDQIKVHITRNSSVARLVKDHRDTFTAHLDPDGSTPAPSLQELEVLFNLAARIYNAFQVGLTGRQLGFASDADAAIDSIVELLAEKERKWMIGEEEA